MCDHLFFFNDTATTEIYTLSLHDALPIYAVDQRVELSYVAECPCAFVDFGFRVVRFRCGGHIGKDRKSTRLNSSHANISYAVFCLKKQTRYLYITPPVIHYADTSAFSFVL